MFWLIVGTLNGMVADSVMQESTVSQKRVQSLAFVISAGFCVLLCGFFATWGLLGLELPCEIALDEKINPNDAPTGSLVRLPGIGIGKAGAIVAYRENTGRGRTNTPAFQSCYDLQQVHGIGPKTVQSICEWLRFEQERRPAFGQ